MNEDIKKNEIPEAALENVSGGAGNPGHEVISDSEQIEPSKQIMEPHFQPELPPFCEK